MLRQSVAVVLVIGAFLAITQPQDMGAPLRQLRGQQSDIPESEPAAKETPETAETAETPAKAETPETPEAEETEETEEAEETEESEETPSASTEAETPAAEETPETSETAETPAKAETPETPETEETEETEETAASQETEETPSASTEAETPAAAAAPAAPQHAEPVTANTPVQIYVPDPSMEEDGEDDVGEAIGKLNETIKQEQREREEGGTCCFSGENGKDTCGTCYPLSIASYKSKCSKKIHCLGECQGTWCDTKCVMGAADQNDMCRTAFPEGTATNESYCSTDKDSCSSCKGAWCRAGYASNFKVEEDHTGREVPVYVAPEDTNGVCCYRGADGAKGTDMCGACEDVAKDETCKEKSRCGGCGGTWCPGPRCVKAYKDKKDPCHSAYPFAGIAAADDFCALNEKQCASCKGAWCAIANITYFDGVKYDPFKEWTSIGDQRLEEENHTAIDEAIEEVAKEDSIEDLFPDGLADHGLADPFP